MPPSADSEASLTADPARAAIILAIDQARISSLGYSWAFIY